jgi:hypothetical protein
MAGDNVISNKGSLSTDESSAFNFQDFGVNESSGEEIKYNGCIPGGLLL